MERILVFALFAFSVHCPGQLTELSMELSASGSVMKFGGNPLGYQGYTDFQNKVPTNAVSLGNARLIAGRLTLNTGRWIAHEGGYGHGWHSLTMEWNDFQTLKTPRVLWIVFYDLLACATPEDASFRLCAAAGPHLTRYDAADWFLPVLGRQTDRKAGVNFGGVAKFRVGHNFLVRIDFREYMNPRPLALVEQHGWLRQHELSAGFGLRF
jgi:hypothetical protein